MIRSLLDSRKNNSRKRLLKYLESTYGKAISISKAMKDLSEVWEG